MSGNTVRVFWEFDVTTDEELQRRLGLTEGDVYEILDEDRGAERLNAMCCEEAGVPQWVNLDLFFDDPQSVSNDQILDALSDEYGWLIDNFEWESENFQPQDHRDNETPLNPVVQIEYVSRVEIDLLEVCDLMGIRHEDIASISAHGNVLNIMMNSGEMLHYEFDPAMIGSAEMDDMNPTTYVVNV